MKAFSFSYVERASDFGCYVRAVTLLDTDLLLILAEGTLISF